MRFSASAYNVLTLLVAGLLPVMAQADDAAKVQLGGSELTRGIPGEGPLTEEQLAAWLADEKNHVPLEVTLPLGLDAGASQIKIPEDNPLTRAKIELGRQLYFDTRLSSDNTVSCASCHHPDEGFGRHTPFGIGVRGQKGGRNSPTSYNRILSDLQFWDGRASSLEDQAIGPIQNPVEMANTHEAAVKTLQQIPAYVKQFESIFKDQDSSESVVNITNVGKALASFERVLVTGPAPFDYREAYTKYTAVDPDDLKALLEADEDFAATYAKAKEGATQHPMSASAIRGQDLFFSERVNCKACHVGANLTDEKYHNLGVGADAKVPDAGRFDATGDAKDWGAFKTPTIRNVALSAPYMHDGSQATLEEVVEHYNKGGTPNKNLSDKIVKLNLTPQEKLDLVEFMRACTGSFTPVFSGRLPE